MPRWSTGTIDKNSQVFWYNIENKIIRLSKIRFLANFSKCEYLKSRSSSNYLLKFWSAIFFFGCQSGRLQNSVQDISLSKFSRIRLSVNFLKCDSHFRLPNDWISQIFRGENFGPNFEASWDDGGTKKLFIINRKFDINVLHFRDILKNSRKIHLWKVCMIFMLSSKFEFKIFPIQKYFDDFSKIVQNTWMYGRFIYNHIFV